MKDFCLANGWTVDEVVKEVGSGLNGNRRRLEKVLKDPHLGRLVVEHRDRLTSFGFHWFEVLAELQGFEIVVADKTIDNEKTT
jgi:predicted site-specific integrase-resolvase